MSKLNTLNKELDRARDIYQSAIDAVAMEVSEISGIECQANDLAGDGLGIRMEDDETGSETHDRNILFSWYYNQRRFIKNVILIIEIFEIIRDSPVPATRTEVIHLIIT